jgi:hypothetical protein
MVGAEPNARGSPNDADVLSRFWFSSRSHSGSLSFHLRDRPLTRSTEPSTIRLAKTGPQPGRVRRGDDDLAELIGCRWRMLLQLANQVPGVGLGLCHAAPSGDDVAVIAEPDPSAGGVDAVGVHDEVHGALGPDDAIAQLDQAGPNPLPEDLRLYDLRHTAAWLMIRQGASVKAVQKQLGHATASITLDTYGHLFPDELDALAGRLEDARTEALATLARTQRGPAVVPLREGAGQ